MSQVPATVPDGRDSLMTVAGSNASLPSDTEGTTQMPYPVLALSQRGHLSFSQLALVSRCGEAYRRKYVEGHPVGPMSLPGLVGTAFHGAAVTFETTAFLNQWWGDMSGERTLVLANEAKDQLRAILDEADLDRDEIVYFGNQNLTWWLTEGLNRMAGVYTTFRESEHEAGWRLYGDHPLDALELECSINVAGVPFLGYIDAVMVDPDGNVVIRDLKTGASKEEHALQLEAYRVAFERSTGISADYGHVLYVKGNKASLSVSKFRLSDADVEAMCARLLGMQAANIFPVSGPFTGQCQWCDFADDCPYSQVRVDATF